MEEIACLLTKIGPPPVGRRGLSAKGLLTSVLNKVPIRAGLFRALVSFVRGREMWGPRKQVHQATMMRPRAFRGP